MHVHSVLLAIGSLLLAGCATQTATVPTQAVAERGAVSAADPRAAEAGREILRAGGSAARVSTRRVLPQVTICGPIKASLSRRTLLLTRRISGATAPAPLKPTRTHMRVGFLHGVADGSARNIDVCTRLTGRRHG